MNFAGTKRAPFEVAELVEQEQRMVAGAGIMAVPDAVLLFAVRRAHARIHVGTLPSFPGPLFSIGCAGVWQTFPEGLPVFCSTFVF